MAWSLGNNKIWPAHKGPLMALMRFNGLPHSFVIRRYIGLVFVTHVPLDTKNTCHNFLLWKCCCDGNRDGITLIFEVVLTVGTHVQDTRNTCYGSLLGKHCYLNSFLFEGVLTWHLVSLGT